MQYVQKPRLRSIANVNLVGTEMDKDVLVSHQISTTSAKNYYISFQHLCLDTKIQFCIPFICVVGKTNTIFLYRIFEFFRSIRWHTQRCVENSINKNSIGLPLHTDERDTDKRKWFSNQYENL